MSGMKPAPDADLSEFPLISLLRLVDEGLDPFAMLEYAHRLFYGLGIVRDPEAAAALLNEAAEMGCPEAMYNLAVCYYRGQGVKRSLALSRYWSRSCEHAVATAVPIEHTMPGIITSSGCDQDRREPPLRRRGANSME